MGIQLCTAQLSSRMKFVIIAALLAVVSAAPAELDAPVVGIVSSTSEMNADGSYSFAFESEDGIKVEESGSVSKGSYSFTDADGVVLTVNWVADENGFQATGDHLPTPPPMPEHVVKLLADLKAAGVLE